MLSTGFRSRFMARRCFITGALLFLALVNYASSAAAIEPATGSFQRTWERTDQPVADGAASRTWMWGDGAFSVFARETYAGSWLPDAPSFPDQRLVQYFDKSRMEITDPNADPNSPWYVTNGLLVMELITGRMQTGDDAFEERLPAAVNVAGDYDDPRGPTYASFGSHLSDGEQAQETTVVRMIERDGSVSDDQAFAAYAVGTTHFAPETGHWIATPFWELMNATGLVYEDGAYTTGPLFLDPYYATGLPVTDAYWANVKVGDVQRDVLMQCFERRCLTYTPSNDPAWRVEAGNVGQHYYSWRYGWGLAVESGGYEPAGEWSWPDAQQPRAIVINPDGSLFASDNDSEIVPGGQIVQLDADGTLLNQFGGEIISNAVDLALAQGGDLLVLDGWTKEVHSFSPAGEHLASTSLTGSLSIEDYKFAPLALAVDPASGDIFVLTSSIYHPARPLASRVYRFSEDGALVDVWDVNVPGDKDPEPSGYGLALMDDVVYVISDTAGIASFSLDGAELKRLPGFTAAGIAAGPDGTLWLNRNVRTPDGAIEFHVQQIDVDDGPILRDWTVDGEVSDIAVDPETSGVVVTRVDEPSVLVYSLNPGPTAPAGI
jgi:hypothetical protein